MRNKIPSGGLQITHILVDEFVIFEDCFMKRKEIYCAGCETEVNARLTNGKEIYPHRNDLHKLPFWRCDTCNNYVGCHHKSNQPTTPLGCIPTPALRAARRALHRKIDPLWQSGVTPRRDLYKKISDAIGYGYGFHTANIRSLEEAARIDSLVSEIIGGHGNRSEEKK